MVNVLLGMAPSQDLIDRIVKAGLSVDGVDQVHDINVHDYGQQKVISLHVVIPGELDTMRSHHLATLVEKAIRNSVNAPAVVHVDPSRPSQMPQDSGDVENALRGVIQAYREIEGFGGLTAAVVEGRPVMEFSIKMSGELSLQRAHAMGRRVVDDLKNRLSRIERRIWVLKNNLHFLSERLQLFLWKMCNILILQNDSPRCGFLQSDHGSSQGAFSTTAFTNEA
jgi:divalent metal cation (Fe/Co/Zn/Cd) transporter